jgi:predicted DNA-binding transcriptional regulator AlpA
MSNVLDSLPTEMSRYRILGSADAAKFWGVSVPHWRRLERAGKVPKSILVGDRKKGWQLGALIDSLEARS